MCDFDDGGRHERKRPNRMAVRFILGRLHSRALRGRIDIPNPPLQSLVHTLGLAVQWTRWDRTKHGWHLVIKLRQRLTLAEIIAAQAILGSDRARERLNLARCISIRLHPSRFWERRSNILYKRKVEQ
jgi:hypothetical protein